MSASAKKIVLKKLNSHNTIWHPESTLVFKSQKDKLVIGRYVNDEIIPLDDVALTLCDTWKFKPDESLFDDEDNEKDEPEPSDEEPTEQESTEQESVKEPPTKEEPLPKEPPTKEPPTKEPLPKEPLPKEPPTKEPPTKEPLPKEPPTKEPPTKSSVDVVSSGQNIKSLTECFTIQIYEVFNNLDQEKSSLTAQLEETQATLSDLQKKYDDIKKKFDTMKSLFN
jgi:outer membrane biosynthesis protein TonB